MTTQFDAFTRSYMRTALCASIDDDEEPMDSAYDTDDFAPAAVAAIVANCKAFQSDWGYLFEGEEERAGCDYFLTRNRHGAGFWDGDWTPEVGAKLTGASHAEGSMDLYVGDDGLVHVT